MKPVPRKKHRMAALILVAVAGVQTYLACLDNRLDATQVRMVTARHKRQAPEAMSNDPTFGPGGPWRVDNPFQRFLAAAMLTDESGDEPYLAFGLTAGVFAAIYLFGMYALLVTQCRFWSLAVLVAVCSLRVIDTMGGATWGAGALTSATGEGLFIALSPWLVLAALRAETWRETAIAMLGVGVVGNLYLPGAAGLTVMMLAAYLARERLTLRRVGLTGLYAACVCVALLPAWLHNAEAARALAPGEAVTDAATAMDALAMGNLEVGYGAMLPYLLNWALMIAALILASGLLLLPITRHRMGNRRFWLAMLVASLVLAGPVHGLSILVGSLWAGPPPAIGLIRVSALAMLPLYVLVVEGLVALFRALVTYRRFLRVVYAILLPFWFVGSANVRIARHAFLEAATVFLEDEAKPRNVRRHREQDLARRELRAIAMWARDEANTSSSSIFLVDSSSSAAFRMLSYRAVAACRDDALSVYALAPQDLGLWHERVQAQARLLAGQANANDVKQFATEWQGHGLFTDATTWYLIRPKGLQSGVDLVEESNENWGEFYRVLRYDQR